MDSASVIGAPRLPITEREQRAAAMAVVALLRIPQRDADLRTDRPFVDRERQGTLDVLRQQDLPSRS